MSFTDTTPPGQREAISFEAELRHPPQKVWRALTDPALLSEWLLPVLGFRAEVGAAFAFRTDPYPGWDGVVHCEMREVEPERRLAYRWAVPGLETVVSFELAPTAEGTRLVIVQTGFQEDQKREFGGARYGWTKMGGQLAELLDRIP